MLRSSAEDDAAFIAKSPKTRVAMIGMVKRQDSSISIKGKPRREAFLVSSLPAVPSPGSLTPKSSPSQTPSEGQSRPGSAPKSGVIDVLIVDLSWSSNALHLVREVRATSIETIALVRAHSLPHSPSLFRKHPPGELGVPIIVSIPDAFGKGNARRLSLGCSPHAALAGELCSCAVKGLPDTRPAVSEAPSSIRTS